MRPLVERLRMLFNARAVPTPQERWDTGLAAAIASASYDSELNRRAWNATFKRAKSVIPDYHNEYGARP